MNGQLRSILVICLSAALFTTSVVAGIADADAVFSTATTQSIFNDGFRRLQEADVYATPLEWPSTPVPVALELPNFLPQLLGLDALHDLRPDVDGLLFSTVRTGGVVNNGIFTQLFDDRVYLLDATTGVITLYAPLAAFAPGSLDGLAAIPAGPADRGAVVGDGDPFAGAPVSWAFSTASVEFVVQAGGTLSLQPGNIYGYDRLSGSIALLEATGALGVGNVDALNVVAGAAVQFSIASNRFVSTGSGLQRLLHNDVYEMVPQGDGVVEFQTVLSGNDRRIIDLDAFSTPQGEVVGACCLTDSCVSATQAECSSASGDWQGPGTACGPESCDDGGGGDEDPTWACRTLAEGSSPFGEPVEVREILTLAACDAEGGVYDGDDTTCDDGGDGGDGGDDPTDLGACVTEVPGPSIFAAPEIVCELLTAEACDAQGGEFSGIASDCDGGGSDDGGDSGGDDTGNGSGACLYETPGASPFAAWTEVCAILGVDECADEDGAYQGDDSTCPE